MSINFNHVTNDISASSGSVTINGSAPGGGSSTLTISNKTGAYTVVAGDNGTVINCTSGTFTVALTAAATLGSGFNCWIWNTSTTATDVITIDPNSTETIDGRTTIALQRGEGLRIVCDGTNWQVGDQKELRGWAENMPISGGTRPIATGDGAVAIGRSASSTGVYTIAAGNGATVSANYGVALGANSSALGSQAVTGAGAMALGGSYASGTDSFAAAIANNTSTYGATGQNSVAFGYQAKATALSAFAGGGRANQATGGCSVALGGGNTFGAIASQTASIALGEGANSRIFGKTAISSSSFASSGDAQTGILILGAATTDATAKVLVSDGGTVGNTNQVILPNNSAYAFTGIVVARRQAAGGTASAAWKVEGLIRREGTAGTTTLVASTVTAIDNTPGWTLALSADTTNGGLAVTATGAAATNIRWVATINTSEVTYA